MAIDKASATHDHRDAERSSGAQEGGTTLRTPWRRYGESIVLGLVLALAMWGCSGGEEDLTGTWTGTLQDSVGGIGTILLTISQSDSQLTGTWQSTFPDPANNNGGTLSGTVGDPSIALVLTTSRPPACSFTVAASRDEDDEDHFTATYASLNCARQQGGNLDVTRQ